MNRQVRVSIMDICIGYGCAALVMYAVGGIAYVIGKTKGKLEMTERIQDLIKGDKSSGEQ